jgi:KipI family sensor histidine kinase inhibitor
MSLRVLACGEHAVMVELDGLEEVLALDDAVRAAVEASDPAFAGVVDIIPAARTLLVVVGERADLKSVRQALPILAAETAPLTDLLTSALRTPAGHPGTGLPGDPSHQARQHVVEIRVHYDGPDLSEISERIGLTPAEVVAAHTQTPWRVAFSGFSPGFAYLSGGDSRLQVPRRSEPRTSVPAGSVGLAGEFSAIYPRSSPGGWQLLGHIDEILWDVDRQPPALLQPGSTVRFVDIGLGGNAVSG